MVTTILPMYYFLSCLFHCSFKASGSVSAAKPYLISSKSIPFPTNRLTLTTVNVFEVNAILLGITPTFCPVFINNKIRDKMKL